MQPTGFLLERLKNSTHEMQNCNSLCKIGRNKYMWYPARLEWYMERIMCPRWRTTLPEYRRKGFRGVMVGMSCSSTLTMHITFVSETTLVGRLLQREVSIPRWWQLGKVILPAGDLCHFVAVHGIILPVGDGRIPGKFGCHLHCRSLRPHCLMHLLCFVPLKKELSRRLQIIGTVMHFSYQVVYYTSPHPEIHWYP